MDIDESLERDLGIPTFRKIISMVMLLFSSGMKVAIYSTIQPFNNDIFTVTLIYGLYILLCSAKNIKSSLKLWVSLSHPYLAIIVL